MGFENFVDNVRGFLLFQLCNIHHRQLCPFQVLFCKKSGVQLCVNEEKTLQVLLGIHTNPRSASAGGNLRRLTSDSRYKAERPADRVS